MKGVYNMEALLRARNLFFAGMCTLLAPRQTSQHRIHDILAKDDMKSLRDDWYEVGNDIQDAMEQYVEKYERR